jgi:hypothetical protein
MYTFTAPAGELVMKAGLRQLGLALQVLAPYDGPCFIMGNTRPDQEESRRRPAMCW